MCCLWKRHFVAKSINARALSKREFQDSVKAAISGIQKALNDGGPIENSACSTSQSLTSKFPKLEKQLAVV